VSGALLGAVTFLLLAGTGVLLCATLRIAALAEFFLATYVVSFGTAIGLFLFLSVFGAVTRAGLIVGSAAICASAAAVWFLAGAPHLPSLPKLPLRPFARHRPLVLLASVVAVAFAYVVALIVGTPPNGWDPLNYHLARAAFWLQSGGIGYIEPVYDERLNLNPPNGEIGSAFALGTTHDEVMVGFVQLSAALACALGVFALARRVGLSKNEGAFGSLLFLTLPIVLLQSSVAKNDLVLASFLVAAAVLILGPTRLEIGLASLATALAVGTKSTAAYGVAVLLVVAVVASPPIRRRARVVGIVVGALVGSYWYAVNALETGHLLGDQSAQQHVTALFQPAENLFTAYGMAVDTLDVSGARGRDILLYAVAALALAAGFTLAGGRRSGTRRHALLAAAFVASPLALFLLSEHIGRPSLERLYDLLGKPNGYLATGDDTVSSPATASDTASWFGPAGFLFVVGAALMTIRLVRSKALPRLAGVLALAPLAWFVLVALSLTYNPWLGRFFIFPVALSAALWGRLLRTPAAKWGAAGLASITALLSLVHYVEKPSGLRLLDRSSAASVWQMKRWQVQSQHDPAMGPVFRFLDEDVPRKTSIALAIGENDFGYPAFGPHLERHVEVIPFGSSSRGIRANWLLASSERAAEIDSSCWRAAFQSAAGTVFRRAADCGG
jgi:hypothetical protein